MANTKNSRSPIRIKTMHSDGEMVVVTFGRVKVEARKAPAKAYQANVRAGQEALARAAKALPSAGVKFRTKSGVPTFRADPKHPGRVIRTLKGKTESGIFEGGDFRPVP